MHTHTYTHINTHAPSPTSPCPSAPPPAHATPPPQTPWLQWAVQQRAHPHPLLHPIRPCPYCPPLLLLLLRFLRCCPSCPPLDPHSLQSQPPQQICHQPHGWAAWMEARRCSLPLQRYQLRVRVCAFVCVCLYAWLHKGCECFETGWVTSVATLSRSNAIVILQAACLLVKPIKSLFLAYTLKATHVHHNHNHLAAQSRTPHPQPTCTST